MGVRVSCPFCNAVVEASGNGRTACPRCQETFDATSAERAADAAPVAATTAVGKPGFLYSRGAVFLSLGIAAVILFAGLVVVRPWQASTPPRSEPKFPVVVSPLGLSGLTYLPARTNIVAALQPKSLLAYAPLNKTDPRKFLVDAGVPEDLLAKLGQAGVSLDQIDHAVVGLAVSLEAGKVLPDLVACLKLTRPIDDEAKFLTQLKAEKNSQQSKGRTVYSLQLGAPLLMTRIDDRTYLFTLDADGFGLIDRPMPAGGGQLPASLRDAMTTRISPASFAWVASSNEAWTEMPSLKLLPTLFPVLKERWPRLAPLRAVAAGVSMEPEPQLRLAVRTADREATATVQTILKEKFTAEAAAFHGDAEWAVVQSPFDPKTTPLRSILSEAMSAKP